MNNIRGKFSVLVFRNEYSFYDEVKSIEDFYSRTYSNNLFLQKAVQFNFTREIVPNKVLILGSNNISISLSTLINSIDTQCNNVFFFIEDYYNHIME